MENRKEFFTDLIYHNFIPYWRKFEDSEYGGICNCINNYGDLKINDNKFIWSQGRYLWILSELYGDLQKKNPQFKNKDIQEEKESILFQMKKTYDFIVAYGIDRNNHCFYLLNKSGTPLMEKASQRLDASIFADCFALIGMANYVKQTKDSNERPKITALYQSIVERIESGNFHTEPYPIAANYQTHSIAMIMINTTHEYIKMQKSFGIATKEEIIYAKTKIDLIFNHFYDGSYIREYITKDYTFDNETVIGRHINPGHTFESLWFIIEFLQEYGECNQYIDQIRNITIRTFLASRDYEYGGLMRFIDIKDREPTGSIIEDRYEKLILETHDMKLWWPHSEALYLFALLFKHTKDEIFSEYFETVFEYAFQVFPNKELGEWIQILNRDGTPSEKIVALPVKDPFHILRNFMKLTHI